MMKMEATKENIWNKVENMIECNCYLKGEIHEKTCIL